MRLYHFTTAHYGLDNIDRRRLKIATIPDLNDPYELLCMDLSDKNFRWSMNAWKEHIGGVAGMLCFSKDWHNPVQWSHYTDKHKGICLGFDIAEDTLFKVQYRDLRSSKEASRIIANQHGTLDDTRKVLSTKYKHWQYEQEYRVYVDLLDIDPVTKLHFTEFGSKMVLREVIIGAKSNVERLQVAAVLRELDGKVDVRNARLGFKKYEVVTQQDQSLWK
jgi:hypothetical protein